MPFLFDKNFSRLFLLAAIAFVFATMDSLPLRAAEALPASTTSTQQRMVFERPKLGKVGAVLPNFRLLDDSGQTHMLRDYQGKFLMLIWVDPKGPVTQRLEKAGALQALAQIAPDQVVTAHVERAMDLTELRAKPIPRSDGAIVFRDPRSQMASVLDLKNAPAAVLLDKNSKVLYRGAIDNDSDGTLEPAQRIPYAANALKSALRSETPTTTTTTAYGDPLVPPAIPYTVTSRKTWESTQTQKQSADEIKIDSGAQRLIKEE